MPKKKEKKDKEPKFTVCGEFFPEVYPAFRSKKWSRGDEDPLATEMRLFCSCERWAFNCLLEGASRDDVKKRGQEIFGINSRYADDARLKAKAVIDSQKELLEIEIDETESKLSRAKKKLAQTMRKLAKAEKKDAAPEEMEKLRLAVNGRNARVASLEKELAELKAHQKNGTIPKVVFGGKKLWKDVCKRRVTREEWRAVRKNRLYSRGDEKKGGNPHFKVSHQNGEFRLAVTISHLSEQTGTDTLGRPVMTRAPKVEGKLWLPEKHRDLLRIWLAMELPYTVELIHTQDGRYLVHLTFDLSKAPEPDFTKGCLSVDTNPDGVGLSNIGPTGQPEPWPEDFSVSYPSNLDKYEGEFQVIPYPNGFMYIRIPDLEYARSFRRTYLIGVLAKVIVDIAKFLGKPIALEDLDFDKDRLDIGRKFNRMAANFPYAKMVEAVYRRATKEKVPFKPVPPRHTSTIGYWKYMYRFAVPIHCVAALVIGRRAMGYREKVTKELKHLFVQIKQNLAQKASSDKPREGKGMTRWVRACLKRLEKKIPLHNGLPPEKQIRFYSLWHDFKLLARVPTVTPFSRRRTNRLAS